MDYCYLDSPIGRLLLAGDEKALKFIFFPKELQQQPEAAWHFNEKPLTEAAAQLKAYFAGRLKQFSLPIRPHGTPFQQMVWEELRKVPYAATVSYGELARRVGRPKAARAVGAANGRNPIPIIIPCHRVIGASGHLTGFGGGLPTKRALLELEQANA